MIVWDMLVWWYTDGWRGRVLALKAHIAGLIDYFSIGLLAKTLFAPFRQISAGRIDGPIDVQLRAFFDRLISRFIGAAVRLIMMFVGVVGLMLGLLVEGSLFVMWAIVPLMPLVGAVLFVLGWVPWNN